MAEPAEPQPEPTAEPGPATDPGRGHRHPHRPGPAVRDGGVGHPGRCHPDLEIRSRHPPGRARDVGLPRRQGLPRLRGRAFTFAEHYRAVATLAHALVDQFGISKGDRVAIAMRNLPEWVMAFWASIAVGAVVVPLNAWWTGPELAYGLSDSGTALVFVDEERRERILPHLDEIPDLRDMVVCCEEHDPAGGRRIATGAHVDRRGAPPLPVIPFSDVTGPHGLYDTLPPASIDPDDDATIFYTSGTTGRPKGAVGTHRNSVSNLMNLFFVATMGNLRRSGPVGGATQGTQNANLLSVPLFHATGCHAVLVSNTAAGGKLVMMHHFDPERALELIERERITIFGGVPAMVMQVIDSPDFATRDTSSVRSISYGGAPCPPDLVRRITQHFPGGAPGNGYGLTETSAMTTMNSGDDYVRKPDSVGPPAPVCDVAVVEEDYAGSEPPADQPPDPERTGELWIKGPNVVRGYWNRPQETAASFTEGWLHTGDVARIDEEGFVHIVDRAKDMIIRGGRTSTASKWRPPFTPTRRWPTVPSSGCPTPCWGKRSAQWWCCGQARAWGPTSWPDSWARAWLLSTCPPASGSGPIRCPVTRPARCSSASCGLSSSVTSPAEWPDGRLSRPIDGAPTTARPASPG